MWKRFLTVFFFLSCTVGVGYGAWRYWQAEETPISYRTVAIERGSISRLVTATGTVNPVSTVQVGSQVSGTIKEIFVDFNSSVKHGQRVAQIDPRPFVFKMKQAEANLATAQAQVDKDRADLDFKRQVLKRTRELFERNLVAKQDVEAAERDYEQMQAQLQLDQARIAQENAALEEARVNLGYTDIVSPVDGIVVSRNVDVGQTVASSFQTPVLFLIARDLTKMQVNTNVSESDIGVVADGQRVFFTVDAYPERTFWGEVMQVRNAPQTVQNVVTYDVVVSVDNADLALKPGMTANISIISAYRENVLKVPLAALRFRPPWQKPSGRSVDAPRDHSTDNDIGKEQKERKEVWVQTKDHTLQAVPVRIGIDDERFAELLEGDLSEGERVVTAINTSPKDESSRTSLPGFGMRWRR